LAREKVNVVALTIMDSHEHSLLRLVTNDVRKTSQVLDSVNAQHTESEVLVVDLRNQPGALARVCEQLALEHINIDYAYCSSGGRNGKVVGIFKVSNVEKALRLLRSPSMNNTGGPKRACRANRSTLRRRSPANIVASREAKLLPGVRGSCRAARRRLGRSLALPTPPDAASGAGRDIVMRQWVALGIFFTVVAVVCLVQKTPETKPSRKTEVSIHGKAFHLNGRPTYAGHKWQGHPIEGLLFNSRMVQGIFDDLNPDTRKQWTYPDTNRWDAERNTREFLAAMPEWRRHGLLAFTLNLQGGNPRGYRKD